MNFEIVKQNVIWTDEQLSVLRSEPNVIISGCAGSGKTLLATHLSVSLEKTNNSIALIVFTKALRTYLKDSLNTLAPNNSIKVFYREEWNNNKQSFDYLIIDEYQDFTFNDVTTIQSLAGKGIFLFGDFDQQIYHLLDGEKRITPKELNSLSNFQHLKLTTNYRIPKEVVQLAGNIAYTTNNKKALSLNKSISSIRPLIKNFENHESEINWIVEFLRNNFEYRSIGILFNKNIVGNYESAAAMFDSNNEKILSIKELSIVLKSKEVKNVGYKYFEEDYLDFTNEFSINLLTIHSSKGLEFDCVIIPFSKLSNTYIHKNQLYVALTRTKKLLIITYSGLIVSEYAKVNKSLVDGKIQASEFINLPINYL